MFVNYALFVGLYHRPKTGTWVLSYDHSWVFMAKLSEAYGGRLPHPQGLATKRWLALSAVVPPSYEVASIGPFLNVDAVPADIRAPYRPIAQDILTTDEAGLDRILGSHRLPTTFKLNISSIPISWYVGLKESDELGVKVFFESILHHPREYLASIARASAHAWWESPAYPIFPTAQDISAFTEEVVRIDDRHLRLVQRADPSLPYRYSDSVVWSPGYWLFSQAQMRAPAFHRLFVGLIVLGSFAAALVGVLSGWTFRAVMPLVLTVFLVTFVIVSTAVLEFRWKEIRFVLPVMATLVGIAAGWTLPEVIRCAGRRFRLGRAAAAVEESSHLPTIR
jgi:hypothetical protein